MKPIVQYQIEVAICMAAFTLIYLLLWRKETNFLFKRYLLLGIPLFSMIIPIINLNIDLKPEQESSTIQYFTYIPSQLELVYAPIIVKTETLSNWEIAFWIMSIGAFMMLLRLIISYIKIIQIYNQSIPEENGSYRTIDDPIHSFSFFNMIIINRNQKMSCEKDYIIAHENAHKNQGHSWDILWLELIKMVHWFNPMIWLLSNESKKNLEYLADQEVANSTGNVQNYQYAIVQHAAQSGYQLLKTQFSKTNLKNRIIMMNQPNNHKIASWKLFAILPVLAILFMSFSLKVENLDIKKKISEALPSFNSSVQYEEMIYEESEVRPLPDGKRMKFFYEELYKRVEKETGKSKDDFEGKVIAHLIVLKDGSLKDIRLIQGINAKIDDAIIQFIKDGPKWTPGLEVGEPVNVRMVLPIQFGTNYLSKNSPRLVTGKLVDEQKFTAIAGAKVEVKDSDIKTFTDEIGMFQLSIEPKHTELLISSNEFETKTFPLHPNQGFIKYMIRTNNTAKATIKKDSIEEIFTIVEDQPKPTDGDWTNYYESINKSIRYPASAAENNVEGKVFVQFIVRKDGSLSDLKAVKGIGEDFDKEAIRVIKDGPRWKAGQQRGQNVNVRMILPVTFIAENKIMGTVVSEDRKPIAGANVIIKGTTTGTVTDNNGKFILQFEPGHSEIVVSYIGYLSQIKSFSPGKYYTVEMQIDPDNPPDFNMREVVANEGGIKIQANGQDVIDPDKKPLFIVEGVEMENFDNNTINPDDINSIQVIKDEMALKSFGEKGKNGVIMIDLKEGVEFHTKKKLSLDEENPPIILINGKEATMEELEKIAVETIASMEVTKDQTILEPKYGERGKNGLIKIKLKSGVEFKPSGSNNNYKDNSPLIIVDGVETEYSMDELKEKYPGKTIDKISILKDPTATKQYGEKGKNGVVIIKTRPITGHVSEPDVLPEYEKGQDAFYKSFQKNIKYPKDARNNNIQGEVLISFTVNKKGEIENVKAEKTKYAMLEEIVVVGYSNSSEENNVKQPSEDLAILEEEVIRIFKQLSIFKPGSKDGQAIDVRMTLPVTFRLN